MKRVATQKHEPVVSVPEAVGMAVVAIQPQLAVVEPLDVEHPEAADRAGDGLHRNEEPLTIRLVRRVLQAQLRTDFVRTQIESKLLSAPIDVGTLGATLETELGQRDDRQINFHFLGAGQESGLAEDIIAPIADLAISLPQSNAKIVSRSRSSAKLDGTPGLPDLRRNRDNRLASQKARHAFFPAEFVPNRLNLPELYFAVFHEILLWTDCPSVSHCQ